MLNVEKHYNIIFKNSSLLVSKSIYLCLKEFTLKKKYLFSLLAALDAYQCPQQVLESYRYS